MISDCSFARSFVRSPLVFIRLRSNGSFVAGWAMEYSRGRTPAFEGNRLDFRIVALILFDRLAPADEIQGSRKNRYYRDNIQLARDAFRILQSDASLYRSRYLQPRVPRSTRGSLMGSIEIEKRVNERRERTKIKERSPKIS